MNAGEFQGEDITIDMTTINVLDLKGQEKENLENHLKGYANGKEDHFYNVNKYAEANFEIPSVKIKKG